MDAVSLLIIMVSMFLCGAMFIIALISTPPLAVLTLLLAGVIANTGIMVNKYRLDRGRIMSKWEADE